MNPCGQHVGYSITLAASVIMVYNFNKIDVNIYSPKHTGNIDEIWKMFNSRSSVTCDSSERPLYHVISPPKITEAPAPALHRKQWPPGCSAKPANTWLSIVTYRFSALKRWRSPKNFRIARNIKSAVFLHLAWKNITLTNTSWFR